MRCFECDEPAEHKHHVVPVCLGGTRTVPLCSTCHGKIHSLDFTEHGKLIRVGLERARAEGQTLGRPKVYVDHVKFTELLQQGMNTRQIARSLDINRNVAYRHWVEHFRSVR